MPYTFNLRQISNPKHLKHLHEILNSSHLTHCHMNKCLALCEVQPDHFITRAQQENLLCWEVLVQNTDVYIHKCVSHAYHSHLIFYQFPIRTPYLAKNPFHQKYKIPNKSLTTSHIHDSTSISNLLICTINSCQNFQ